MPFLLCFLVDFAKAWEVLIIELSFHAGVVGQWQRQVVSLAVGCVIQNLHTDHFFCALSILNFMVTYNQKPLQSITYEVRMVSQGPHLPFPAYS